MTKTLSAEDQLGPLVRLIRDARSTKESKRFVLWALAARANPAEGFTCSPSIKQLAEDTQLHADTVKTALRDLVAQQLITRHTRMNSTNVYKINVALLAKQAAAVKAKQQEEIPPEFFLSEEEHQVINSYAEEIP